MKATLLSWTQNPIATILNIWDASKGEERLDDIVARNSALPTPEMMGLFERVIDQQIPVAQFVTFNFVLEDVPVSWREQAVRHRIGVKYGDNYAVDIVPEADISFWSQSMRIQSMERFADEGRYHMPKSIAESDADVMGFSVTAESAADIYIEAMEAIEGAYIALVGLGIPMEDARNLIPLGATHRIAMSVNLQSLKHIIGERGCWILQGSLWGPIIESMVAELSQKVHPVFRRLVAPPCVSSNVFTGCKFVEENIRRVDGRDALPTCPLYATEHNPPLTLAQVEATTARIPEYSKLWNQPDLAANWSWTT